MSDIQSIDKNFIANTYNRFDLHLVSGKGSLVYDENGKEYIDLGSGIGVTAFGISDKQWVSAVTSQAKILQHTSNLYYTEPAAKLAEILCKKTDMEKVFFCNSGAEANECAIKVARKYAAEKKGEEYYNILTLTNSFHGRTLTTLAATGQDKFHTLFNPLTPGFVYTPANDIEALKRTATDNKCAAIMVECIQGEGGVLPLNADFLIETAEFAKENDIILIVDEVQTGNGRTGKLYAYMNFDIKPDIITTAKGLGGGLPIGAAILSKKVESVLGYGDHGSTYGGNPVCCAGALNVISRIDEGLLNEVKAKGEYIYNALSGVSGVTQVTGMGLMIGIKTKADAGKIVNKCIDKGVLCLTAKDRIRLLPALNIPYDTLKKAIEIIKQVISETEV